MQFMDLELARRVEMAEATACSECADAFQKLHPEFLVAVERIGGGIAVFAGVESPVTQAIGVGINGPVEDDDLNRLGDFFLSRNAPAAAEICPFVDMSLYEKFATRSYRRIYHATSGRHRQAGQPRRSKTLDPHRGSGLRRALSSHSGNPRRDGRFFSRQECPSFYGFRRRRGRWRRRPDRARRRMRPVRRQHLARDARPRRAGSGAAQPHRLGDQPRLRSRRQHRPTRQHLASQHRTRRLPRRLHAHEAHTSARDGSEMKKREGNGYYEMIGGNYEVRGPTAMRLRIKSTIDCVVVPGRKISAMPAFFSAGISASGIIPPIKTVTSVMPFSRSNSMSRGHSVLCAPERIESPMTSTSSCTAADAIISGVCRSPV